jgi:hypothetical protein
VPGSGRRVQGLGGEANLVKSTSSQPDLAVVAAVHNFFPFNGQNCNTTRTMELNGELASMLSGS